MIMEGAGSEDRATRSAGEDVPGAAGWVPFSHRYGIATPTALVRWCHAGAEGVAENRWRSRHTAVRDAFAGEPESGVYVEPLLRCTCPGSSTARTRCADRASQEDRLCDPCREHCWGVQRQPDGMDKQVRLVDAYGMAGPLS